MCIYSSLCGLEAPVEGGKCRGVITYYYSRPSSSLLARPNFFVLLFYMVKRKICLRFGEVSRIRLTAKLIPCEGRVLNTLKNLFAGKTLTKGDLSHKFTLSSTHRKSTQTCCCCSVLVEKQQQGFQSAHTLSLTHIHSHSALLLCTRSARAREVEVCCSETWTREE